LAQALGLKALVRPGTNRAIVHLRLRHRIVVPIEEQGPLHQMPLLRESMFLAHEQQLAYEVSMPSPGVHMDRSRISSVATNFFAGVNHENPCCTALDFLSTRKPMLLSPLRTSFNGKCKDPPKCNWSAVELLLKCAKSDQCKESVQKCADEPEQPDATVMYGEKLRRGGPDGACTKANVAMKAVADAGNDKKEEVAEKHKDEFSRILSCSYYGTYPNRPRDLEDCVYERYMPCQEQTASKNWSNLCVSKRYDDGVKCVKEDGGFLCMPTKKSRDFAVAKNMYKVDIYKGHEENRPAKSDGKAGKDSPP